MTRIALSIAVLAAFTACSGDDDPADTGASKTSVATAAAGDLTVELLTDTRLETGMTPIHLKVTTATGQAVTDAAVTFTPMMTMAATATMPEFKHSAPVLGTPTLGADGLYHVTVVFQMQSSAMGTWWAKVGVTRPGAPEALATFAPFTVADSGRAKVFLYPPSPTTLPQTKYVMSMNFVSPPKVGLNPILVTLHSRSDDMMSFPAVDDATFALDPQMPSMGHGSPGSVNPTRVAPGVYEGQLSFSMAGEWETTVTVTRGGATIATPKFVTTF